MSEDYLAQQQPTQTWNTARGVWEKQGIANLLCEHWELFSETWQTSGMMRNGKVYELPTQALHITDSEFSSLPTPAARDYKDGTAEHERDGVVQTDTVARAIFNSGEVLIPTTRAQNGEDRNNKIWARDPSKPQNLENALAVTLLPTTRTSMANGPTQKEIKAGNPKTRIETEVMLMPTPTAVDGNTIAKSELDGNDPKHRLKVAAQVLARDKMQWGKFEPAIRRWEQTLGRPSPLPTKPDGKDGAHRLSSAFTEWMMGLPKGWVTGVGLTRNEELKACGNGVVPQQAELALRILLEGVTLPAGGGQVNLPTPTVSDTYTDNLQSTQQKERSMHSVTLPQAVRMVSDRIEVARGVNP